MAEISGFEEYVTAHGAALVRLAGLLTGDPHRAEDLVQDVLARAYPRWQRIADADRPELYLRRMMVNLNASWWRRRTNREVRVPQPAERSDHRDVGDQATQRVALWAEVAALPARQRAVVALRYYEDLDDQRISEILGCSPATVRTHAMRGLAAMRDRLRPSERDIQMHPEDGFDPGRLAQNAARTARRRQGVRRSAIAAAIAAFAAAAAAVPVLLISGARLTPGDDGQPLPDVSPPPRGAYAVLTPPRTGGKTADQDPSSVGADPFTFHFDLDSVPYPPGEVRWRIGDGVETLYAEMPTAEGYGGGFELQLGQRPGPTVSPTAQPTDPTPMVTSSVLVQDRPATLWEGAPDSAVQPPRSLVRLTWQPTTGVYATLTSESTGAQDLIAMAAGLRLTNHRCAIPLKITALPPDAQVRGCAFTHFGGTDNTTSAEVVLGRAGTELALTTRSDLHSEVLPSASAVATTSHGFSYAEHSNDYYTSAFQLIGPFDVELTTTGQYGRADAVQVIAGLIPTGDPGDPQTWPVNPIS